MDLLRVRAESAFRSGAIDPRPTLSADDGRTVSRFAALPAPADVGRTLRCAYAVPEEVVSPDVVFSLEFDDGFVIALPHPRPGPARVNRRVARPAADSTLDTGSVTEERRSELQPKLAELSASLADAQRANERLREDAEAGREARSRLLAMHVEGAETQAELQALRDLSAHTPATGVDPDVDQRLADAEERLAASRHELSASELRHSDALARAESTAAELAVVQAGHEDLQDRFARLESDARAAAERFIAAERERDQAIEARREVEESVEPLRASQARAEQALAEAREQTHVMSLERDELSRQVSAFDGVAVKARERAAEAEGEQRRTNARLSELEVWSGELERRLADATTELSHVRSEAGLGDSELRRLRGELAEARAQVELHSAEITSLRRGGGGAPAAPAPSVGTASNPLASAAPTPAPIPRGEPGVLDGIADAALELAHRQASLDLQGVSRSRR